MKKIISPPHRVLYQKDDRYIFFDPVNVTWVKVNDDGKKILIEFEKNPDFDTTVQHLKKEYNTEETIIIQFLNYIIEKTGYLHWDKYIPKKIEFNHTNIVPKNLYIHPTYLCNLQCKYCYNEKERNSYLLNTNYQELSLSQYEKLFIECREIGIKNIVYSGGEPLLHTGFFDIARLSFEMGFNNSVITNGTLISEENVREIKKYFNKISVSIDSCNENKNDYMRGKGTFLRTMNGISLLLEQNIKVNCLGVICPENINSMLDSWNYFVKKIGCATYMPQLYIDPTEACKDIPQLYEFAREYGRIRFNINTRNGTFPSVTLSNNCGFCYGELAIGADGNVFPCQTLMQDEMCAGNIKNNSLKDILNSSLLTRMRSFSIDQVEECKNCDIKYLCGGTCRGIHSRMTGTILKNNPYFCTSCKEIIINSMFEVSSVSNADSNQDHISNSRLEYSNSCL